MTSACWASTDRATISCWPVRAVPPSPRRGLAFRALRLRGRRREQRAEDLHALEQQLDARAVDAGDDGEGVVDRVGRDDRELVGADADDHVDVVAGLDDRADARHLVDLDRDRALARWDLDVEDLARLRRRTGPAVIAGAGHDGLADDLADDLGDVAEGVGVARRRSAACLDGHLVRRDRGAERDVGRRDDGVPCVGTAWRAVAAGPPVQEQDRDECDDRQEDPDEQDQAIRTLQETSPRVVV